MLRPKPAETTLYAELIRRGLPADYARRTAEELDDHRADLLADLQASDAEEARLVADSRLGATHKLAKKIASDYRRRSWFGRWPLVGFLLLPPFALVLGWVLLVAVMLCLGQVWMRLTGFQGELWSPLLEARVSYWAFSIPISYLLPSAIAWFLGDLALARAQSRSCLLMACLMVGLTSGLVGHEMWIDPDDPTRAMNGFSFPIPLLLMPAQLAAWYSKPAQLAQLLIPCGIGMLRLAWHSRDRRSTLLAQESPATTPSLSA